MEQFAEYLSHQTHTIFNCEYCDEEFKKLQPLYDHISICPARKHFKHEQTLVIDGTMFERAIFCVRFKKWRKAKQSVSALGFVEGSGCPLNHQNREACVPRVCTYKKIVTPLLKNLKNHYNNYLMLKKQSRSFINIQKLNTERLGIQRHLADTRGRSRRSTRIGRALAGQMLSLEGIALRKYGEEVRKIIIEPENTFEQFTKIVNEIEKTDLEELYVISNNNYWETAMLKIKDVRTTKYTQWIHSLHNSINCFSRKHRILLNKIWEDIENAVELVDVNRLKELLKNLRILLSYSAQIVVRAVAGLFFLSQLNMSLFENETERKFHFFIHNLFRSSAETHYNFHFERIEIFEEQCSAREKRLMRETRAQRARFTVVQRKFREAILFFDDINQNLCRPFGVDNMNGIIMSNFFDIMVSQNTLQPNEG